MADISLIVDYKQVKQANQEILKIGSSAQKSASTFEKAFGRAEKAQGQLLAGVRKQMTFSSRMAAQQARESRAAITEINSQMAASRRLEVQKKREADAAMKAARDTANANRRLRMEFREGYAAQVQLRAAQMRLSQAFRQGIIDANSYKAQLQQLTAAQQNLGVATQVGGRRMSGTGMAIQQTGYQVGDFLVQVQGGTNAMVAFGQQATQLVGILPMVASNMGMTMGAAIKLSAGLGIAIPLLTAIGAYFMRTKDAAREAAGSIETFEDRLKSARSEIHSMKQALEVLRGGFEGVFDLTLTQEIAKARSELRQAQMEINVEVRRATAVAKEQAAALGNLTPAQVDAMAAAALSASTVLQAARERLDLAEKELAVFEATALEIRKRGRDESVIRQLHEARLIIQGQEEEKAKEYQERLTRIRGIMGQLNAEARESAKALEDAAAAARLMAQSDMARGVLVAAEAARKLAADLGVSLQAAMTMAGMISNRPTHDVFDPRDPRNAGRDAATERARRIMESGELSQSTLPTPERPSRQGSGGTTQEDPIAAFEKQLALEEKLIGKTEARKRVIQALGIEFTEQNVAATSKYEADINRITELNRLEEQRQSIIGKVESSMESAFMSMVDGTKSVKDAFKSMAAEIIKELYRIYVIKRITGMVAGAFGGGSAGMTAAPVVNPMAGMSGSQMLPQAMGGAWMKGVQMFANGGVVDSPTMFGHSGGVGVMGEAGPEAIMPLKRGSDGKLGVSVEGGSGAVNVTNNINVTGGSDPAAIRMEVAKLMPQITSATKSAVIDARRRGGQMRAAFN